ncbi:MAG TPA: hypothetical protein VK494_00640, partial [Gemmatimonadaceae bacterium]|nr:hypothetical protein [Gemmatimonadaceae bacterium]
MHAPNVERGFTGGLTASYTAGPEYENGDAGRTKFAYGPLGFNVGYGWSSDHVQGLGFRVGAYMPVPLVVAIQPDAYFQFPKRALLGLDGGVGVVIIDPTRAAM